MGTTCTAQTTCAGHGPSLYLLVKGGASGGETKWTWQAFGRSDNPAQLGSGSFEADKTVDLTKLAVANGQRVVIVPNPDDKSFTDSKSGVPDGGHYTLCKAKDDGTPDPTQLLVAGQFGVGQPDLLRPIPAASGGDLALTVTKWNDSSRTGAGFSKIKHFFVLMLENRSFDHIFGFQLPQVDGTLNPDNTPRTDCFSWQCSYDSSTNKITQSASAKVSPFPAQDSLIIDPGHEFSNVFYGMFPWAMDPAVANTTATPDMHGFIAPYLNRLIPRTEKQGQWDGDALASHNFKSVTGVDVGIALVVPATWPAAALASLITSDTIKAALGSRDIVTESKRVMEAFTAGSGGVVNITKLAQQYAVCDRWFSSLPGPTWPNRLFVHCGGSGGLDDSPSAVSSAWKAKVGNYALTNIYDTLAKHGCEWMIYACGSNAQADTVLLNSKVVGNSATTKRVVTGDKNFAQFEQDVNGTLYTSITNGSFTFLEPDYGDLGVNGALQNNLAAAFLHGNSQHPISGATSGDQLIGRVAQILQAKPDVWNACALIVTHDEHGGFYDHVVPPGAVPPNNGSAYHNDREGAPNLKDAFSFNRLGVRVPAVVISPLIPQGVVDHTVYDHTSIPNTVRKAFGITDWVSVREGVANDFSHLFTLTTPTARK